MTSGRRSDRGPIGGRPAPSWRALGWRGLGWRVLRWRLRRSALGGVRMRSALSAASVVMAAVGMVALGLVLTARVTLTDNVDATATQRAGQVIAAIRAGDLVRLDQTMRASPGDQTLVQVLTSGGSVLGASTAIAGRAPISPRRPAAGTSQWDQRSLTRPGEDPFRILTTAVADDAGTTTYVVVAQSLRPVNESIEAITSSAAVGTPVLAAVAGVATFVFVSRSLRPVEDIRRRVATITSRDLEARVPVPAARDEIAALAETMNGMLDRLQSAADIQRRFVADASHELRGPLTTLQVGLGILAAAGTVPATQISRLQGEADRLGRLVADLLLLARIDEHALTVGADDVDLDDIAYAHRDRLLALLPELRVTAQIVPARVRGDARHLDRAVRNLCDNAARHAHSEVSLTVRLVDGWVDLFVADDGDGVDPADQERVFDRFVRLGDSRTRSDGGAGLGLAIAREIARAHAGTLSFVATDGPGACLRLRLPSGLLPPGVSAAGRLAGRGSGG